MTLQVNKLSKKIDKHQIISNITFNWAPGEIIGLVGRNGVGKTTLFSDHGQPLRGGYRPGDGR